MAAIPDGQYRLGFRDGSSRLFRVATVTTGALAGRRKIGNCPAYDAAAQAT